MPTTLAEPRLGLGRAALHRIREILERELPDESDALLREIGFAAGPATYEGFVAYVAERYGVDSPQLLDARFLSDALAGFLRDEGWGTLSVDTLAPGILALDSTDLAEAEPRHAAYPACHVTSGLLSDVVTRLGGQAAAVLEVECRSRGDARCRFLVGSPDMLTWIYDGIAAGESWSALVDRARG